MAMADILQSPEASAPTGDWLTWLNDLRELSPTAEVRTAIRRAIQAVEHRRATAKRATLSRREFCLAED